MIVGCVHVAIQTAVFYAESRVAFVIGNKAYTLASPLNNPHDDSREIGAKL